jgi:hypothetical protein
MSRIIIDAATATRLGEIEQVVELCDPAGRVLGRFLPTFDMSEWEPITPDVSEEELDRREKSAEKRYTTEEVLTYLKGLEQR